MFDIWRKINKKGAVAVPVNAAALTPLAWVEVGEVYPEFVPEQYRKFDILTCPQLIKESPFTKSGGDESRYLFHARDPLSDKSIKCSMHYGELVDTAGIELYHADENYDDDDPSFYRGILTCGCGEPGCAGIWSQTFHVSDKMVHWSILHYEDDLELFFERKAYEKGLVNMLKEIVEHPCLWRMVYDSSCGVSHSLFVERVYTMLSRRKDFNDIWEAMAINTEDAL